MQDNSNLRQPEASAHSIVHTVLIICSADILSNAIMLRLLHLSFQDPLVALQSCWDVWDYLYHQSFIWTKNLLSLHTSWLLHILADLLRPLSAPHCLGASPVTLRLLRPQSSLVCLIIRISHVDLISQIHQLKRSPPQKPAQIPASAPHLAQPTTSSKQ